MFSLSLCGRTSTHLSILQNPFIDNRSRCPPNCASRTRPQTEHGGQSRHREQLPRLPRLRSVSRSRVCCSRQKICARLDFPAAAAVAAKGPAVCGRQRAPDAKRRVLEHLRLLHLDPRRSLDTELKSTALVGTSEATGPPAPTPTIPALSLEPG